MGRARSSQLAACSLQLAVARLLMLGKPLLVLLALIATCRSASEKRVPDHRRRLAQSAETIPAQAFT